MSKQVYRCKNCQWESLGWVGKCGACGEWNTLEVAENDEISSGSTGKNVSEREIVVKQLADIDIKKDSRILTGFSELDLVLGGGYVKGSLVLLTGEPGVGKSTLALASILKIASNKTHSAVYVSGEESMTQVAKRAQRLLNDSTNVSILEGRNIDNLLSHVRKLKPDIVVWDSLQAFSSDKINGIAGGITQSRYICNKIVDYTRKSGTVSVLIGQVTKEGVAAGPKVVEHIVDGVFYVEPLPDSNMRIVRSQKNRFGSTMEVGILDMDENGFRDVSGSDNLFVSRDSIAPGVAIGCILEGSRTLDIEVQGLVVPSVYGMPRRMPRGIQRDKLEIIVAILTKILKLPLGKYDVFVNVAGGLNVREPYIDLAVAAAIISSLKNLAIEKDTIFSGELSLSGVVRHPTFLDKRVRSAEKLGYKKFVTGRYGAKKASKIVISLENIRDLTKLW